MVEIVRSTIVDAPIEAVWALLRDFAASGPIPVGGEPGMVEDGRAATVVGAARVAGSGAWREQLLDLDDRNHVVRTCLTDTPLPLYGYVSRQQLRRVTDGDATFWQWRASFATDPYREADLAERVAEQVMAAGFAAIRARVARARAAGAQPAVARVARAAPAAAARGEGPLQAAVVVVNRHGGPEVLENARVTVLPPGPGQVRVRQTAIGVNFIDVYCRTGAYPLLTPPGTPGMEACGFVVDVGEGVVGILPGDRVAYAAPPVGAYAGVRIVTADSLVPVPQEIDDETAAAAMLKGLSAEYLLHRVHRLREGERVLIHSAAGGMGLLLCQWAKKLGAVTIGTVSSPEKARLARDHGCDYPIVSRGTGFLKPVQDATRGKGCDVVYDGIGRASFLESFEALAMRGHLVSYGQSSGPLDPVDPALLSRKSASLTRPVLFHFTSDPDMLRAMAANLFAAIAGGLRAGPRQRYPLAEAARAHRELEGRRTVGASVLIP
jgi:NADPH:quinone reductase-like Zn-dependent oxidoreductase